MADIKSHSTLTTNLVSYWDLEEASGTRYDLHGSNDLTDGNTVTQGTGKVGNCADIEGSNSEYLSGSPLTTAQTNFSVSCWVKIESVGAYQAVWTNGTQTNMTALLISPTGGVEFFERDVAVYADSSGDLSTATWYHLVIVKEGDSSNNLTFYIDGASAGTASVGTVSAPTGTGYIGCGWSGSARDQFFDGLVDEVGVWSKALTSSEVTDLYNSGNGLPYYDPDDVKNDTTLSTSLVSYWELEETSGTRVDSVTATGNDLTDNGTVLYGTGKNGNAADFETTGSPNEYLSITDASQTNLTQATTFSVSTWIKPESLGTYEVYGKQHSGDSNINYRLIIFSDGSATFQSNYTGPTGDPVSLAASSLSAGTWANITTTFSTTNGTKLYLNGVLKATSSNTSSRLTSTGPFTIGARDRDASLDIYYDGLVDETIFWSKELSLGEVRALYGYGTPPPYSSQFYMKTKNTVAQANIQTINTVS